MTVPAVTFANQRHGTVLPGVRIAEAHVPLNVLWVLSVVANGICFGCYAESRRQMNLALAFVLTILLPVATANAVFYLAAWLGRVKVGEGRQRFAVGTCWRDQRFGDATPIRVTRGCSKFPSEMCIQCGQWGVRRNSPCDDAPWVVTVVDTGSTATLPCMEALFRFVQRNPCVSYRHIITSRK